MIRVMKMSFMGMISAMTVRTVVSSVRVMASVVVISVLVMMTSVMIIILAVMVVFIKWRMRTMMKTLRPRVTPLHAVSLSSASGLAME